MVAVFAACWLVLLQTWGFGFGFCFGVLFLCCVGDGLLVGADLWVLV